MNRNSINVGKKIKTYRKAKKYTLKNLAEKTGLSIGFLSQLERGMTTIAIDSLFNLANVLDVDIMDFFDAAPKSCDDPVVHSYSRPVLSAAPETVQFYLGGAQDHNFQIVPKLLQLMPSQRYLMCPEQPAGESREKEEGPRRADSRRRAGILQKPPRGICVCAGRDPVAGDGPQDLHPVSGGQHPNRGWQAALLVQPEQPHCEDAADYRIRQRA